LEEQKKQVALRNIVVTAVMTPPEGGQGPLDISFSVSVNGKNIEGVQLALVLSGPINVTATAGTEHTAQTMVLARGLSNLAEGLRDQVLGAIMDAIADGQAQAAAQAITSQPGFEPQKLPEAIPASGEIIEFPGLPE
jgi:hypothetical protein